MLPTTGLDDHAGGGRGRALLEQLLRAGSPLKGAVEGELGNLGGHPRRVGSPQRLDARAGAHQEGSPAPW